MHNVVAQTDGEDRFVPNHSINAKDSRVTMAVHANPDLVGFGACAHKDFRDQIVA